MDDGYEYPDLNLATISRHHGNNIERVSENECRWQQTRNDGICVSHRPLQKGDSYEVIIQGAGRVLLGLTSDLPCDQSIADGQVLSLSVGNWHQIRLKEATENISVEYQDKKIWIYRTCEGKSQYAIQLPDINTKHFIIVNALYGDLVVEIVPKDVKKRKKKIETLKWSRTCGLNVLVQESQTKFTLRYINPLGFCALGKPLQNGKGVSVTVLETFGTWHYLCLGLSNKAPDSLALNDWRAFYNNQYAMGTTPWPDDVVPCLKLKCPKENRLLYFMWKGGNSVLYQEGQGETIDIQFQGLNIHQPIYVYLEPFREQICVDSRNILLKDSGTYLTAISSNPSTSLNQPPSQTYPFEFDAPMESDPDQTCKKTILESPFSVPELQSCGPPAFNFGASEVFGGRTDSHEHTSKWISEQQDKTSGRQRRSDPQGNRTSDHHHRSDPHKTRTSEHHRRSDPEDNRASDFNRRSDPQENMASGHHRISDPRENRAGGPNTDPEHSQTDFFRQNREPQENFSSLSSHSTYPERRGDESGPSADKDWPPNRPLPPQPMPTASSKSLHLEKNPESWLCPPPSISIADANADIISKNNAVHEMLDLDLEDKLPPSTTTADASADKLTKNNVVLAMLKQHESLQEESKHVSRIKINNDLSNKKQNKCDVSEAKSSVNEHGAHVPGKLVQSSDIPGTNIPNTSRTEIPSIPENYKLEYDPQQNRNKKSKDFVALPGKLSAPSEKSGPSLNNNCAQSEQRPHRQVKNMRELFEAEVKTAQSGATPALQREISADEIETQKALIHGLDLFGSRKENVETLRSNINDGTKSKIMNFNPSHSSDQEEDQWKNCLQENFTYFIERVEPVSLADKLYEKKCLLDIEYENILKETPTNCQCREIIKVLIRKPHQKYDILNCLDLTKQSHVADRLRRYLSR